MKINLCSGQMLKDGYINMDLLPFTDKQGRTTQVIGNVLELDKFFQPNSVEEIIAFHCLEHLYPQDVLVVLKHCYNILTIQGKLIVECPDFIKAYKYYITDRKNIKGYAHCIMGGDGIKYGESWWHKSMWVANMMEEEMKNIGYRNTRISDGISHNNSGRDFRVEGIKWSSTKTIQVK